MEKSIARLTPAPMGKLRKAWVRALKELIKLPGLGLDATRACHVLFVEANAYRPGGNSSESTARSLVISMSVVCSCSISAAPLREV